LVVTAPATAEIRAGWIDSLRSGLQNPKGSGVDHAFGGTNFLHFDALARKHAWNQYGAAGVVAEGIAAVD
jgi:hypothetical protein